MVKHSILWQKIQTHYTIYASAGNSCKNTKYQCNYCLQIYASNVTRMSIHLLKNCPAPISVKQEIRNIYSKSESSSSSSSPSPSSSSSTRKNFKLNARWSHVSKHYVKLNADFFPNCKKEKYMCNYCNNRYASNVTRMAQHVMECAQCPPEMKNAFYKLSKPKTLSVLSKLRDTFKDADNGEDENVEDVEGDEEEDGTFLYAASFQNEDTIDPVSSNSFHEEMEQLEEKYDITEHITAEGIENIETSCSFKKDSREIDEEQIKTLIARACYSSSTPLNIFENTHWQKLFNIIAPNLNLPTRSELSEKYLNKQYSEINKEVQNKIKDARKLSIQLIGNNTKKLTSIVVILNTPEPVVYVILEANTSRISSNQIENTVNKIVEENNKHIFYPIVCKNSGHLEFNTNADKHISWYICNKHVLGLLIRDLMELDIFKDVLLKYKSIWEEINLDKTICIQLNNWKQLCANLEKTLKNKSLVQKLSKMAKTSTNIKNQTCFLKNIHLFINLTRSIVNWMKKIKPDSCISSVVECYSDLRETFQKALNETNTCILECLDKHRFLAIREVHKAASLLNPRDMGKNLGADEVIDAIEFINKLSQIQPDVKSDKIIYDIAAYRTKQGIWGKQFVWDSLAASELPAIIWWQSMCSSTELCKIAVSVLSCPPVTISMGLSDTRKNTTLRKIEYVRLNMKLLTIKDTFYGNTEENNISDDSDCYSELDI